MSAKTEPPRVALVLGTVMSRRVARGLFGSLDRRVECLLIDAARSLRDIERRLQAWRPHAIVVHGTPHTSGLLRASRRAPVLLVGHIESATAAAPAYQVCVDEAAVGRLAASYYRDRGLRHFAFYGAPQAFSRARQEAFARTLLDAGFRSACFFDQERRSFHSLEGGVGSRRLNAWLRRLPRPIGVFAAHDSDGVQLLQACRHLGLRVPQDVAVVGVNDDAVICSVAFPPLSSVAIPWQRLGEDIARLIGQCLRTGVGTGTAASTSERLLVPPIALITRESSDLFAVSHPGVARALRHCADRVEEPLGVAAFARRAGVSRRLLEMVLRQELGCSPLEVLHRIRIERAKTLLNDTDAKLADIAARCGFAYAERFSVVFKRLTGQTPAAFRRRFSGD